MSFGINVEGGTGAGRKRPLLPANTVPWPCACRPEPEEDAKYFARVTVKLNPGYLKKCIDCKTVRP